jgi:sulfur carrier protein ThiS
MQVKIVIMPNRQQIIETDINATIKNVIKAYEAMTDCRLKSSHSVSLNGQTIEHDELDETIVADGDRIICSQNIDKAVSITLDSGTTMQLVFEGTIAELIEELESATGEQPAGMPFVNGLIAGLEIETSGDDIIEFKASGMIEIIKNEGEYGETHIPFTAGMTINDAIRLGLEQMGYTNYNTDEFSVFDFNTNPSRSYSPQTRVEPAREGMSLTISTKEKQIGG